MKKRDFFPINLRYTITVTKCPSVGAKIFGGVFDSACAIQSAISDNTSVLYTCTDGGSTSTLNLYSAYPLTTNGVPDLSQPEVTKYVITSYDYGTVTSLPTGVTFATTTPTCLTDYCNGGKVLTDCTNNYPTSDSGSSLNLFIGVSTPELCKSTTTCCSLTIPSCSSPPVIQNYNVVPNPSDCSPNNLYAKACSLTYDPTTEACYTTSLSTVAVGGYKIAGMPLIAGTLKKFIIVFAAAKGKTVKEFSYVITTNAGSCPNVQSSQPPNKVRVSSPSCVLLSASSTPTNDYYACTQSVNQAVNDNDFLNIFNSLDNTYSSLTALQASSSKDCGCGGTSSLTFAISLNY